MNSDFTKNGQVFRNNFNALAKEMLSQEFSKIENYVDKDNPDEGSITEIKNVRNIEKTVHYIILTASESLFRNDQNSADCCFKKYFYKLKPV